MKRMTIKRALTYLALSLVLCLSLGACAPKRTEFDDKEIVRIETRFSPGESTMRYVPTRIFDFELGTVTDECVEFDADESASSPEQISTFTAEAASTLVQKITSYGFYSWKDYYDEDEVSCGGTYSVKVIFSDETVKTSGFYLKHPREHKKLKNYDEIEAAFVACLGAELFMEW